MQSRHHVCIKYSVGNSTLAQLTDIAVADCVSIFRKGELKSPGSHLFYEVLLHSKERYGVDSCRNYLGFPSQPSFYIINDAYTSQA